VLLFLMLLLLLLGVVVSGSGMDTYAEHGSCGAGDGFDDKKDAMVVRCMYLMIDIHTVQSLS
jgi:hypothetical protein